MMEPTRTRQFLWKRDQVKLFLWVNCCYSKLMCFSYNLGSFGVLILQVPVIGGYFGGKFRVKTESNISQPSTAPQSSNNDFHATLFYDNSKILMDPVTSGSRIILVYNLRRTTSIVGIPQIVYEDSNSYVYSIRQLPRPPPTVQELDLRDLFLTWSKLPRNPVYAIPLMHTYSKKDLCFATLKGSDYSIAQLVLKLLGDFVEIHLATVTKYVGYKEEDWYQRDKWATSGSEITSRKTNGKCLEEILENDWTEYLAGNWCDADNHQLLLPPLPILVPDQLLKFDDSPFNSSPPLTGGMFDGLSFDRASIILWPREKTFGTSLLFGLDQALDVAENGFEMDPNCDLDGERRKQMEMLLAFCKKEPNRSWFASPLQCDDLRCDRARPVSPQVASKRALRLMDLCINWKLPEFGNELLYILFSTFERTDYRCHNCFESDDQRSLFVGGICSKEVANKLADLFAFLGVVQREAKDLINLSIESIKQFDLKQIGHLAYLATCLFHRQLYETATLVCDEAYSLLTLVYLKKTTEAQITDGIVGSCIEMLHLIDGSSEECRLSKLLLQLDALSVQNSSLIIGWLQETDHNLLKSLPSYLDFYMKLVDRLESQLVNEGPPTDCASPLQLEESSAQLISTYLKLEDDEKLDSLVDRIVSSKKAESRLLLAATISSHNSWFAPSSPSALSALATLSAVRVQQLVRFKFPRFKWEQYDAVFKGHPEVEKFLHSAQESMAYNAFNSEEEAKVFASNFFDRPNFALGYSACVSEIIPAADGGMFSARITKTPEICELSLKQLEALERSLSTPATSPVSAERENHVEAKPTLEAGATTSNESQSGSKTPPVKRRQSAKKNVPPEKRSKRILAMASKVGTDETPSNVSNPSVSDEIISSALKASE